MNLANVADSLGMKLWYHIPISGYSAITQNYGAARTAFSKPYQNNNDLYQAKWNNFTISSDKVYNRKTKLYTLLYDLYDRLSLEAGTRQETTTSSDVVIGSIVGVAQPGTSKLMLVEQTGAAGIISTGMTGIKGNAFQQNIQSGKLSTETGSYISQKQLVENKITSKAGWAEDWDFEKERKYVKQLLQVPKIVQFSGRAYSDKLEYAKLTLDWKAEHPVGVTEYSFSILDYSQPVSLGDISQPSSTSGGQKVAIAQPSPLAVLSQQAQISQIPGVATTTGQVGSQQWAGQMGSSAISYTGPSDIAFDLGTFGTPKAWRTLATKQKMVLPFIRTVHKPGNYDVWIRARGAGGYTIGRLGNVKVEYCGSPKPKGDLDWSTRNYSLSTTDNTPPTTPYVVDTGDTTSSTQVLHTKWGATDYESGIQEYQYQVGYYQASGSWLDPEVNFIAITSWVSAGGQTEMNIRLDKPMKPGVKYFIKVKAKNGVGKWSSEGSSDGIELSDSTPPSKAGIKTVSLSDSLEAVWSPANDPESKVLGYLFALGQSANSADVINWSAFQGTSLSLSKSVLQKMLKSSLQKGLTYYFSVKAMNGIGILGDASSKVVIVK